MAVVAVYASIAYATNIVELIAFIVRNKMEDNKSIKHEPEVESSMESETLETKQELCLEKIKKGIAKTKEFITENPIYVKGIIMGVGSTCIVFFAVGVLSGSINLLNIGNSKVVTNKVMNKIQLIDSAIDEYYLYDIDEEVLVDMIYAGYVVGLGDAYSNYYNEAATKALMESTSGEYTGVGALLSQSATTGTITITNVYDGTPAQEAGLQVGDILIKVDGEDITDEDLSPVIERIKGEEGTLVELTILRGDNREELTIKMTRKIVETTTVEYEMLPNNIGYIYIDQFDKVTTAQFETALDTLKSQGMERVIFDLRNNPGGSLSVVCDILDMIIDDGLLVYTEDKNGKRSEKNATSDQFLDIPMVVLVNGNSASASEIFAGAIQDYQLGAIIGETTYGKGVVQQLIDLRDGTMLKLTISEYFTPLGRNIHGIGIEPDIEVVQSSTDTYDKQLQAAIAAVKQ